MADMSDRDTSMRSGGNYSGNGGQDSPSESSGGPGSGAGSDSGGGSGGGLNSAGNRASGAGPGASSNRSTTGGGFGGGGDDSPSESSGGPGSGGGGFGRSDSAGGGGMGGGMNSAGNRASGAGPGASANRSTTGGGYGSGPSFGDINSNPARGGAPGFGGMNSPRGMDSSLSGGMAQGDAGRSADLAQAARDSENASMAQYNAQNSTDLAQQARVSENQSMTDLARERALGTISTAEVGLKDPYNTLSGGLIGDVTNMTVRQAVAYANTTWPGKISNVLGAYQFKGPTLQGIAAKMGLLDAKMTPAVQDQLAVGLLQQRADAATVNGQIDVGKFAHELSKEWASIATTTGSSYYSKNGVDKASISYAKARDMAESLVSNGVVSAGRSIGSITSKDVSSYQTNAPGLSSDRFSSTYMGGNTSTAPSTAGRQQNDPSGLSPGTYPAHVAGDGLAPSFATPAQQTAAAPSPPTPAAASAPAPAPTPASRSIGQRVAAAGIDIGLGMLPGIGTAASVINGGLALTGNRTLGERTVDSFVNGDGGAGPDSGTDRLGGGNDRYVASANTTKSTVPAPSSFEDRYINNFVGPTPAERWNYNTPGYS